MEDEDEYLDYYDFSKTYKNHPLMIEADSEAGSDAGSEAGWESCDEEDAEDDDDESV
tara:strand:- start:494 stop:664 length:171 start_codon:yes stop_codon:yes gene_type:complete